MAQRVRWELEAAVPPDSAGSIAPGALHQVIERGGLTSHFQPIIWASDGSVYGHEALARVLPGKAGGQEVPSIVSLFQEARASDRVAMLDVLCRSTALRRAHEIGLKTGFLFINVCPETLMDPAHPVDRTDELVEAFGFCKDKIVFEITEESAVADFNLFRAAVDYYRNRGYKIAIDDFGVGYGGLKMLANIEPDFVKVDRHFVLDIDRANVKRNLVDSIATACHRLGIKVIAEGIEREADLCIVLDMGIELLQGYALGMPSTEGLPPGARVRLPRSLAHGPFLEGDCHFIGDVTSPALTLPSTSTIFAARDLFNSNPEIMSLPIVDHDRVMGMLHRRPFFEEVLAGRLGYGQSLATYRKVGEIARNSVFVCVEAQESLEDVARRLSARETGARYDDICVTNNGKYRGTVAVSTLLAAITERSLNLARGSNPLSGLPGNEAIRREIEKRIGQMMHFDVCYLDIDHFKPFNDTYGFDRGDEALRTLTSIITSVLREVGDPNDFAGHIGGDDFLIITRPQRSFAICQAVTQEFEAAGTALHGSEDHTRGWYEATNRRGVRERLPLMALSIGIVSTEVRRFDSFAELASIASEVKREAKLHPGSTMVRDRRRVESSGDSAPGLSCLLLMA